MKSFQKKISFCLLLLTLLSASDDSAGAAVASASSDDAPGIGASVDEADLDEDQRARVTLLQKGAPFLSVPVATYTSLMEAVESVAGTPQGTNAHAAAAVVLGHAPIINQCAQLLVTELNELGIETKSFDGYSTDLDSCVDDEFKDAYLRAMTQFRGYCAEDGVEPETGLDMKAMFSTVVRLGLEKNDGSLEVLARALSDNISGGGGCKAGHAARVAVEVCRTLAGAVAAATE